MRKSSLDAIKLIPSDLGIGETRVTNFAILDKSGTKKLMSIYSKPDTSGNGNAGSITVEEGS
eukprot:839240-Ditylum_brightwellii.AAC.1